MSQHCTQVAKKASVILASRTKAVIVALYSALLRPQLKFCVQFLVPHSMKAIEVLESVQRRVMKLMKGLGSKYCEEQLRELGLFSLDRTRLKGDLTALYSCLKGVCNQVGIGLFSQAASNRARGNGVSLHQGRFNLGIRKNVFTESVVKHWNWLPREVVESPFLEVFKK
ncbi:hypothetical protein WISP_119656 [Willisornis vidua]|uniref:Uncharacterized protein n=1 Tax=Willisornis vidua TaxID=1566151 RepID=A0ABQ9CSS9_9PASS|nr:hypothetical protein WISP_119656 [Willisornis vidua]